MAGPRTIVTGAAGFIGSHMVEALVDRHNSVIGIDSFTDYYSPETKVRNLSTVLGSPEFQLLRVDLASQPLEPLFEGVETVFHLAAQPGVRGSWASGFDTYVERNILGTQRLLEASRSFPGLRIVNASSSSVYGNAANYPTSEEDPTRPLSPYGVTKLAAEHLCSVYGANFGLSTVSLRFFSVYGPRQRPDMANYRIIQSAVTGDAFPLFGDGNQVRDFTFVGDVVAANLAAASADVAPGSIYNIGGGSSCTLSEMIDLVSTVCHKKVMISRQPPVEGDAVRTGADISKAARDLGWSPNTSLEEGIVAQVSWQLA